MSAKADGTTGDPGVGFYEVTVRENSLGEMDVGYSTDSDPPSIRGTRDHGYGTDLSTPAFNEVRDAVDLEEHDVGEHIATIHIDLDQWVYRVEFHVDRPLLQRIRGFLP